MSMLDIFCSPAYFSESVTEHGSILYWLRCPTDQSAEVMDCSSLEILKVIRELWFIAKGTGSIFVLLQHALQGP